MNERLSMNIEFLNHLSFENRRNLTRYNCTVIALFSFYFVFYMVLFDFKFLNFTAF